MSPRTKKQFDEIREESREKILQTAMRVFARDGYSGSTVRVIVKEAGISQGLLYNYFAGKEDLLKAVYLRGMKDVGASFAEAETGAGQPPEKLAVFIRSSFRHVRENREFWQLSYNLRMQRAVLSLLADEVEDSTAVILKQLEKLLRKTGNKKPRIEAAMLFALIDGVSQHYVLNPDDYPLEEVTNRIIERYCRASET